MIQTILVLLPGVVVLILVRADWKQHLAKYGPPPAGHHKGTLIFALLWSLSYILLGWQFPRFFGGLVGAVVLLIFFDSMTFGLVGFKSMGWSRKQQVRDGFVLACLFVLPVVFMHILAMLPPGGE